jgi:hypothetical protein
MLDSKKVRLMTELAHYETEEGKEDLKISRYYRSDYIGIGLLKNLLLVTLGYILLWGLLIAYNLDFLLDNLHKLNFSFVIVEMVAGYIVVVMIYSTITYAMRFSRYLKAKRSVQEYYDKLDELTRFYGKSKRKTDLPQMMRGASE